MHTDFHEGREIIISDPIISKFALLQYPEKLRPLAWPYAMLAYELNHALYQSPKRHEVLEVLLEEMLRAMKPRDASKPALWPRQKKPRYLTAIWKRFGK